MASTDCVRPDDERKLLAGCAVTKESMPVVETSFRIATVAWREHAMQQTA